MYIISGCSPLHADHKIFLLKYLAQIFRYYEIITNCVDSVTYK